MLLDRNLCSSSGMGSGLVRGVCLYGDSGNGMREGVISRSVRYSNGDLEGLLRMALSPSSDFLYQ
jgi:hypothetical protein